MTHYRTLIVEDEVIIADTLKRYLQKQGHEVVGTATSYEEATEIYQEKRPDLTLLDIQLAGSKTGIDVAQFIQSQPYSCPHIYLSSQLDQYSINRAKTTLPSGYLTKPIHKNSLYTTIEMAMYAHQHQSKKASTTIRMADGTKGYNVEVEDIAYLQADHIYVRVHLKNGKSIMQRTSLSRLLAQLPTQQFIQTHRTFAINKKAVSSYSDQKVRIGDKLIPVSRARKKEVFAFLRG